MRFTPCRHRTFATRYVRSKVPQVQIQAAPGGMAFGLDLGPILAALVLRETLERAGVRPGSV